MAVHATNDGRQLLERASEGRPLAGLVLQDYHCLPAPSFADETEQRIGDELQSVCLVPCCVTPRMEHDSEQSERFGPIELVGHCVDGLAAQATIGRGQI